MPYISLRTWILVCTTSLLLLLHTACGPSPVTQEQGGVACQDGLDNDSDGKTDCADDGCKGFTFCQKQTEASPAACQDKKDNDNDGQTDCDDPDCQGFTFCQKAGESSSVACQDKKDNDNDGKVDCADDGCKGFTFCQQKTESSAAQCRDKQDNDNDGKSDCDDPDCQGFTFCQQKTEDTSSACQDKFDNDSDGKTDCEDDDCKGFTFCQKQTEDSGSLCKDKKDNDGDGKIDCDDPDCQGFTFCQSLEDTATLCKDKKDNDNDGKIDCEDDNCSGFFFCAKTEQTASTCRDKKDNDGDGKIDCDDPDCQGFTFCQVPTEDTAVLCQDKKDNDGNGKIDCDDDNCKLFVFCQPKTESTPGACKDKKDNDGDGKTDCDDPDCQAFAFCQQSGESTFAACQDKQDNDNDGKSDCDDSDCWHWHFCAHYSGFPITDAWGATWDGLARAATTWSDAEKMCQSKGGRLPTVTELHRNNVKTGGSTLGNVQSTEYLWTRIMNYQTYRITLRLSDGTTSASQESSALQYRCIWPPSSASTTKGFNSKQCHGTPGSTCFKVGSLWHIDSQDRPALDYAAAVNECTFYNASIPTLRDWTHAIHQGLDKGSDTWQWVSKSIYWYRNAYGRAVVRWKGKGTDRWYYAKSTLGSLSYTTSKQKFRCIGMHTPPKTLPTGTCTGGCVRIQSRRSPFLIDSIDRGTTDFKTAFAACRALGGDLPTTNEWSDAIHLGLKGGSNNYLWAQDPMYWHSGGYGYALIRWNGLGAQQWNYNNGTFGSLSRPNGNYAYRCIWRVKKNTLPTCKTSEVLTSASGKWSCTPGQKGTSAGKASVETLDNVDNAWDGLERSAKTYADASKLCTSLGGRLPTTSELYNVRATGNPHKSIGTSSNTNYLWTRTPEYRSAYRVALRISDGAVTSYTESTTRPFRCIWPARSNDVLTGKNCFGPPTNPCFKSKEGLKIDTYDRPALDIVSALYECKQSGGMIPNAREWARVIHQGLPNGSNNWLWINHPMYWYNGGYGYALARWSGAGSSAWTYTNQGPNHASVGYGYSRYRFRCVYSPYID